MTGSLLLQYGCKTHLVDGQLQTAGRLGWIWQGKQGTSIRRVSCFTYLPLKNDVYRCVVCVYQRLLPDSLNRCAANLRERKNFIRENLAFSSKIHAQDRPNAYLSLPGRSTKTCSTILAFPSRLSGVSSQITDRFCACYATPKPPHNIRTTTAGAHSQTVPNATKAPLLP